MSKESILLEAFNGRWFMHQSGLDAGLIALDSMLSNPNNTSIENRSVFEELQPSFIGLSTSTFDYAYKDYSKIENDTIALIPISGSIMKSNNCGSPGTVQIANWLKAFNDNPKIKGVVLQANSPGGEMYASDLLHKAILNFKKPIMTHIVDGMAASAMYHIASATDEIYCSSPLCEVGSIGVYVTLLDRSVALKKMGYKFIEIYSSLSTEKNKKYKDALAGNTAPIQKDIDFFAKSFIKDVKNKRDIDTTIADPFKGGMFFAKKAIKMGLIDGIKGFDEVLKRMNGLINNSGFYI